METYSWKHGCACLCLYVCVAGELDHPCQEQPTIVLAQPYSKTINTLYRVTQIAIDADRDRCCLKSASLMHYLYLQGMKLSGRYVLKQLWVLHDKNLFQT